VLVVNILKVRASSTTDKLEASGLRSAPLPTGDLRQKKRQPNLFFPCALVLAMIIEDEETSKVHIRRQARQPKTAIDRDVR